jgi:alkylation response protein AidB-like acyl-CoA dehydrogenase
VSWHLTTSSVDLREKVEQVRALRPLILEHRDESDRERRLAQPVVEALARLGAFKALVPKASGGEEWDLLSFMRVVEELSAVDGSVGWTMGVGSGTGAIVSGWLSAEAGQEIYNSDPIGLTAGAGFPSGRAKPVEGGYRLSGRWSFASGAAHASWFIAGYVLEGMSPSPGSASLMMVQPRDVTVLDTWSVGGMRGTSSHDFEVHDVFVPARYEADPVGRPPLHPGPLYRLPFRQALVAGLGPLALGMARSALDYFTELMTTKSDRRSGARMGDRQTVQERLAQAEATVRSARAFLYETAAETWKIVCAGDTPTERQAALWRLAIMHAAATGRQAIDVVYHAAGTTGIRTSSPLERHFRDVHVATQHRGGSPEEMYQVGAVLLNEAQA